MPCQGITTLENILVIHLRPLKHYALVMRRNQNQSSSYKELNTFFFSFLASPQHMEFTYQGSELNHSCDLCLSCGNYGFFNLLWGAKDQTCILVPKRSCLSHFTTERKFETYFLNFRLD